jgi:hypothetical protein
MRKNECGWHSGGQISCATEPISTVNGSAHRSGCQYTIRRPSAWWALFPPWGGRMLNAPSRLRLTRNSIGRGAPRKSAQLCCVAFDRHVGEPAGPSDGVCINGANSIGGRYAVEEQKFLHEVVSTIGTAGAVMVAGPANAKHELVKHIEPQDPRPLAVSDVKRMLLGHWGTTPGQNFIHVHLNDVLWHRHDRLDQKLMGSATLNE